MTDKRSPTPPAPLDYAQRPPRRRKIIGWALLTICILGASFAAWRWGPAAWERTQLLYWQRQCLTYSPPGEMVVYEADATQAGTLLQKPGYVAGEMQTMHGSGSRVAVNPSIAVYRPAAWEKLLSHRDVMLIGVSRLMGWPAKTAICFLGELRTPSGQRRLVIIECGAWQIWSIPGTENALLRTHSVAPATFFSEPGTIVRAGSSTGLVGTSTQPTNLRVFAGQRDPNDPSRLTIRYQAYGQEGMIEAWIDDAGVVHTKRREPSPQPKETQAQPVP